jgi:glycogen debranching enzyme
MGCQPHNKSSWDNLKQTVQRVSKPKWHSMLNYQVELHKRSTHKAEYPFKYEWEEIGPGYHYGPAFGHWDIVHQVIDVMDGNPEHALKQLLNNIENQLSSGMLPGSIWMKGERFGKVRKKTTWNTHSEGHPPLWIFAVNDYINQTGEKNVVKQFYPALVRQISWFENQRKSDVDDDGFFYNDILLRRWESGVDEGIRFYDGPPKRKYACIDATSHVYKLYETAWKWSEQLGLDANYFKKRADDLKIFVQTKLYNKEKDFFFDSWSVDSVKYQHFTFESLFPLLSGIATEEQANKIIDKYIKNENYFNTVHPIATVAKCDPLTEYRMWRGPAWNSMTYWISRACVNYGRKDVAKILLEKALDQTAKQFKRTGVIWEFYHQDGGNPEDVRRKPKGSTPCKDYLGHNPIIAMAKMYDDLN